MIVFPTHVLVPIKDLENQIIALSEYMKSRPDEPIINWEIKRATLEGILNNNKQIYIDDTPEDLIIKYKNILPRMDYQLLEETACNCALIAYAYATVKRKA